MNKEEMKIDNFYISFQELYNLIISKYKIGNKFTVYQLLDLKKKKIKTYHQGRIIQDFFNNNCNYIGSKFYFKDENIITNSTISSVRNSLNKLLRMGILISENDCPLPIKYYKLIEVINMDEFEKRDKNLGSLKYFKINLIRIDKEQMAEINKKLNELTERITVLEVYYEKNK